MSSGAWIVIAVVVVIFIGAVYATYGRRSTGITQRPLGREQGDAPGAEGPSRMSAAEDDTEGPLDTHGTR